MLAFTSNCIASSRAGGNWSPGDNAPLALITLLDRPEPAAEAAPEKKAAKKEAAQAA